MLTKEYFTNIGMGDQPKNKKTVRVMIYLEFNPKDFVDIEHLLSRTKKTYEDLGVDFPEYEFEIGRLTLDAELHYLKAFQYVENPFYELIFDEDDGQ